MTDPVAEAAAQLAAQAAPEQPGIISEIVDEFKALGEKVEHLIHPDAPAVAQPGETVAEHAEAAPADTSVTTSAETVASESIPAEGDAPNVAPAAAEQPAMPPSVQVVSMPGGIVGIAASSVAEPAATLDLARGAIRMHVAAIKQHLSIRGFELSAVADIHAELDAIEKWL